MVADAKHKCHKFAGRANLRLAALSRTLDIFNTLFLCDLRVRGAAAQLRLVLIGYIGYNWFKRVGKVILRSALG
jgi:hypothetical protein